MCMCGEWMVYGDNGDNNGENNGGGSLILLCSFEGIHTFLAFETLWGEWDALLFLFSQVDILYP